MLQIFQYLLFILGWQDIFETEEIKIAEERAKECGSEIIEW